MFPLNAQDTPALQPLFPLGHVKITDDALALMQRHRVDPQHFLARHVLGDFGVWRNSPINAQGLKGKCEIVSVHKIEPRSYIWILTPPDHSFTLMHTHQEADVLDEVTPAALNALMTQCAQPGERFRRAEYEPD